MPRREHTYDSFEIDILHFLLPPLYLDVRCLPYPAQRRVLVEDFAGVEHFSRRSGTNRSGREAGGRERSRANPNCAVLFGFGF